MKKFIVDQTFWEIFPIAQIHVIVVKGIDNRSDLKSEKVKELLEVGVNEAKKHLIEDTFSENVTIKEWREALSKFKTKKGARSSIEALLKRVNQNRSFSNINPLVDIYNSISLKYALPCGGEDIDVIDENLTLGMAKGGEGFIPLGEEKDAPALAGEVIYYDSTGAVCRCLNWREAKRTMLQEHTRNAILIMETINNDQSIRAKKALNELQETIESYFGVSANQFILTRENKECIID